MSRKRKKYKVSGDESLCLAVSVVDRPAVESDFIALSADRTAFVGSVEEGERRMMYGCALRPGFPIYRRDGDREYYLEFDRQAIDTISKNYFKMGFQSNWTAAHKDEVEGLTITESWIKEDMVHDKSIALGLDETLPEGTWFIGVHCDNDNIWQQVKKGEFHGFSIEAIVSLEELSRQIPDEPEVGEGFWTRMRNLIMEAIHDPIEPIDIKDMTPVRDNSQVSLEETEPQPATEQQTENEPEPQQTAVEPKAENTTETENEPQAQEQTTQAQHAAEHTGLDEVQKVVDNLKSEIETLKKDKERLEQRLDEMGRKPSAKPAGQKTVSAPDNFDNFRETMRKYYM